MVVNAAFFLLVLVLTIAGLDILSPWGVVAFWTLYIVVGWPPWVCFPSDQSVSKTVQASCHHCLPCRIISRSKGKSGGAKQHEIKHASF